MSKENNVIPFPTKLDPTIIKFRSVLAKLFILDNTFFQISQDLERVEKELNNLHRERQALLKEIEEKNLISFIREEDDGDELYEWTSSLYDW